MRVSVTSGGLTTRSWITGPTAWALLAEAEPRRVNVSRLGGADGTLAAMSCWQYAQLTITVDGHWGVAFWQSSANAEDAVPGSPQGDVLVVDADESL
jgi:hypothetical protein